MPRKYSAAVVTVDEKLILRTAWGLPIGTWWGALSNKMYDHPLSWCTMPAKLPASSNQGVAGFLVKPWMPPKVVFYRACK